MTHAIVPNTCTRGGGIQGIGRMGKNPIPCHGGSDFNLKKNRELCL